MRRILLGLLCGQILCAAEIPVLRFDDELRWEQIFDFGFRPKHLEGLERNTCICLNQSFWVQFRDRELKFKVENGRVSFSFLHDDFLRMVWHQGTEPMTLEEGKRRSDEFKKVFEGFIIQDITMPPLIDSSGLVDAGNDENNVKARVGEYLIWFGFDNSMGKIKPIIPHFYIAWSFPGMPDSRLKDSGDVVRPPKGYEWYSLDPKVDTPDPGASPKATSEATVPVVHGQAVPRKERKERASKEPEGSGVEGSWPLRIALIALVIVSAFFLKRRFSNNPL